MKDYEIYEDYEVIAIVLKDQEGVIYETFGSTFCDFRGN